MSKTTANDLKYVTKDLEQVLSLAMLTPMDNPNHASCRWGAPILLWGAPGIGKSGRVATAAQTANLELGTVYLATHQPEDISGVTMPDGRGGVMTISTLPQVNRLMAVKRGVLFLDELSWARPAVQAAGLSVVHERYIAGQPLPGGIRIIAAANPQDMASGGWQLTPPMANRFLHVQVGVPDVADWTTWLLGEGAESVTPIQQGEQQITEGWGKAWAQIRGLAVGYMRKNRTIKVSEKDERQTLWHLPASGHPDRGRAWASPRSWETALRCLAAAEILGKKEIGLELLEASVGRGFAASWVEFAAYANLPDPEELLQHGWAPNRSRLDIAHAAYGSAISYALSKKDDNERFQYAALGWRLLQGAVDAKLSDIALAPARSLIKAGYGKKAGGAVTENSRGVISHFANTGLVNLA